MSSPVEWFLSLSALLAWWRVCIFCSFSICLICWYIESWICCFLFCSFPLIFLFTWLICLPAELARLRISLFEFLIRMAHLAYLENRGVIPVILLSRLKHLLVDLYLPESTGNTCFCFGGCRVELFCLRLLFLLFAIVSVPVLLVDCLLFRGNKEWNKHCSLDRISVCCYYFSDGKIKEEPSSTLRCESGLGVSAVFTMYIMEILNNLSSAFWHSYPYVFFLTNAYRHRCVLDNATNLLLWGGIPTPSTMP